MTNQEMLTIVKMRGWRLRSKSCGRGKTKRYWYVVNEYGIVEVTARHTQRLALRWAVALIIKDSGEEAKLRLMELIATWKRITDNESTR